MFIAATTFVMLIALTGAGREEPSGLATATQALNTWAKALESSNMDRVLACYDLGDDVTIIHSTGEIIRGADALRKTYESAFDEVDLEEVVLDDLKIHRQGDVAWAVCRFVADTRRRSDNSDWKLEIRTSFVMKCDDDTWKITFEHSSALPDIPRVKRRD